MDPSTHENVITAEFFFNKELVQAYSGYIESWMFVGGLERGVEVA